LVEKGKKNTEYYYTYFLISASLFFLSCPKRLSREKKKRHRKGLSLSFKTRIVYSGSKRYL
jgi:hypothetical protein